MRKLDRQVADRITRFIEERVAASDDPRQLGKALVGIPEKLWRYRVGDYRIICEIQDRKLVVLVVDVDHRSDAYR
jgi:mRNA interferase RelE/StbE